MSVIKTNREATKELVASLPEILNAACHCSIYTMRASEIDMIVDDENDNEYLATFIYYPIYEKCEVSLTFEGKSCNLKYGSDDNIKAMAVFLNEVRIICGVQCDDWEDVKLTLGIS